MHENENKMIEKLRCMKENKPGMRGSISSIKGGASSIQQKISATNGMGREKEEGMGWLGYRNGSWVGSIRFLRVYIGLDLFFL
jgi:hypothetical protein